MGGGRRGTKRQNRDDFDDSLEVGYFQRQQKQHKKRQHKQHQGPDVTIGIDPSPKASNDEAAVLISTANTSNIDDGGTDDDKELQRRRKKQRQRERQKQKRERREIRRNDGNSVSPLVNGGGKQDETDEMTTMARTGPPDEAAATTTRKMTKKQKKRDDAKASIPQQNPNPKKPNDKTKRKQKQPQIVSGKNGVQYQDITIGKGPIIQDRKKMRVSYVLRAAKPTTKTTNQQQSIPGYGHGKILDSSSSFAFRLGRGEVISGWDIGMQGMRRGGRRYLIVPPQAGYGSKDVGGGVGVDLFFDVSVLDSGDG